MLFRNPEPAPTRWSVRPGVLLPPNPQPPAPPPPLLITARAITRELYRLIGMPNEIVVPCIGGASFATAARESFPSAPIAAVGTQPRMKPESLCAGATGFWLGSWLDFLRLEGANPGTLVVGDPPAELEDEHIVAALELLPQGSHIAFLLPQYWYGAKKRAEKLWSRRDLRFFAPLGDRPVFIGKKPGTVDYAVFIWEVGYVGDAVITRHIWNFFGRADPPVQVPKEPK